MTEYRQKLVEDNIGLAHFVANRYRNLPFEFDEIVSSAYLGLVKAAGKYDAGRGSKFSTYAGKVIANEILLYARGQKKHLAIKASLDGYVGAECDMELGEVVPDPKDPFHLAEITADMQDGLKTLTKKEGQVLAVLSISPGITQMEAAERLGTSQSVISKHMKAIRGKLLR